MYIVIKGLLIVTKCFSYPQTAGKVEFAIKIKVNGAALSLDTPYTRLVYVCYN